MDKSFDYFNVKVQDFTQRIVYLSKKCLLFFQVTNEFGVPVAVHNLSLAFEATRYFNLITDGVNGGSGFEPVILQPGETKDLSFLSLKDEAWEDRILNSILTIHTNISNIHVPLLCFHGLIDTVSIIHRCLKIIVLETCFYAHVFLIMYEALIINSDLCDTPA